MKPEIRRLFLLLFTVGMSGSIVGCEKRCIPCETAGPTTPTIVVVVPSAAPTLAPASTPTPTPAPTPQPTRTATPQPTAAPPSPSTPAPATPAPTAVPTAAPTAPPTPAPTQAPTPAPTPACSYAVQETPQSFTYQGGNGGFSVSTNRSDCAWTATSNVGWIAVTGQTKSFVASLADTPSAWVHNSDTFVVLETRTTNYDAIVTIAGNGSVTYTVGGNGGPARTGTISVAGKTVTITQSGQ
jgi:hypothetical protein